MSFGTTHLPEASYDVAGDVELNEDHCELLQELVNVAMGTASSALAELLDVFVTMHVPAVTLADISQLTTQLTSWGPEGQQYLGLHQSFSGDMVGQSMLVFPAGHAGKVRERIFDEDDRQSLGDSIDDDTILEVANILLSATVGRICEQLGGRVNFKQPRLAPVDALTKFPLSDGNTQALIVHTSLSTEDGQLEGRMAIVQDAFTSAWLAQRLDGVDEELFG